MATSDADVAAVGGARLKTGSILDIPAHRGELARLDPDRPPMKGWSSFWTVRHSAQHQAGLFEEELASAREARRRFPELVALYYDEAEALVALGRTGELDAVIEAFEPLDAPFGVFLVSIAAEADAHGQPATRDRLLDL